MKVFVSYASDDRAAVEEIAPAPTVPIRPDALHAAMADAFNARPRTQRTFGQLFFGVAAPGATSRTN